MSGASAENVRVKARILLEEAAAAGFALPVAAAVLAIGAVFAEVFMIQIPGHC